ncbi:MAG: 6-phosphogluconolactonase [Alphaproteobacteria bacterium]|nr:6-phosphogluconolactonase [Alphaproteobacteria bacterium]MDE2111155.1 6-phosphogluconolactonase [Alphaproteobacteria bacterium]MDE2495973.1 6-phosphogluconolactonase [Alphaproteobacteria bacterium]
MAPQTQVFDNANQLAQRGADWIARFIDAKSGPFRLALTGGSTPRALYHELSMQRDVDWPRVEFFWIDERFVPPDSPDNNYRMARDAFLSGIPAIEENVHPIPTTGDPDGAAQAYEATLQKVYGAGALDPLRPLFDLVLLGLGSDGHICSLLPGSPVLEERRLWVAAVRHGRPETRITLTYPSVQSSRATAFIVTGQEKAQAVRAVRAGDRTLPGGRLRPEGELYWLLDRDAAALI